MRRLLVLLAMFTSGVAACASGSGDAAVPLVPAQSAKAQSVPTEDPAFASSPKPAATTKPTTKPKPTKKPSSGTYYKPRGWDGYADVNCSDIDTHKHALSFFKGTGGTKSNDPYGLDRDGDANPCETLP